MSAKQMGAVWDLDLPYAQAWVLLALVDHADHEGRNIRPGVGLIAYKTGYSVRQVQRLIGALVKARILELVSPARQHRPAEYRACLDRAPRKAPYRDDNMTPLERQTRQDVTPELSRPDNMSPLRDDNMTPLERQTRQDVTPDGFRGDIAVSPKPSGGSESPPPTHPPEPPTPSAGGGGGSVQESRQLLRTAGITSQAKLAALASISPDVIRRTIAGCQAIPGTKSLAGLVVHYLDAYLASGDELNPARPPGPPPVAPPPLPEPPPISPERRRAILAAGRASSRGGGP